MVVVEVKNSNEKRSTSRQTPFLCPNMRGGGGYIEEAHVIFRTFLTPRA